MKAIILCCHGYWVSVLRESVCKTAIRRMYSSSDIYFHTPSRNQTKLWPVEKYWLESFIMSAPSPFLINSFSSFLVGYYLSSLLLLTSFFNFNNSILPQTELQFAKFQNILSASSWFHAWTPALELQTKNAIEIMCWKKTPVIIQKGII